MNIPVIVLSAILSIIHMAYFGMHRIPKSDPEMICVAIIILIFAMGLKRQWKS